MGEDQQEKTPEKAQETAREKAARRRRLAEVFGDALPEQTRDDLDTDGRGEDRDEWFRRQVPPHHGG